MHSSRKRAVVKLYRYKKESSHSQKERETDILPDGFFFSDDLIFFFSFSSERMKFIFGKIYS